MISINEFLREIKNLPKRQVAGDPAGIRTQNVDLGGRSNILFYYEVIKVLKNRISIAVYVWKVKKCCAFANKFVYLLVKFFEMDYN